MNDRREQLCRLFLIAPSADVLSDILRHVGADNSIDAIVAVLKRQHHPWDMTPVLLGNCLEIPDVPPTLLSAAEQSAIQDTYARLSDETKWVLRNYATEGVPAEIETDARATFVFNACSAICQLYGSGTRYKPIRTIALKTLSQYPRLLRTHDPEDLLQIALERLHVNFYRIYPQSYRSYLIRTIQTRARDRARIEGGSPIIDATDPESDENAELPVAPVTPVARMPHSKVLIEEALDALQKAMRGYFDTLQAQPYRSRFQKVALLLIYELSDDVSQEGLAELMNCSPQSVLNFRQEYLTALPTIFEVLTDEVW